MHPARHAIKPPAHTGVFICLYGIAMAFRLLQQELLPFL